ncbi:MAG: oxidoreductase [Nitrososphaerales archaeon]
MTSKNVRALVADRINDQVSVVIKELSVDNLPPGEVLVRVAYSDVNYKDGLACSPTGRVAKTYPIIPGIDFAGTVVESSFTGIKPGENVLATGYEMGVSRHGGFSEYSRVPANWVVRLPSGMTLRDSMVFGTAGLTAALSINSLQINGLTPDTGPVVVTGAPGGVGSIAVALLSKMGYEVVASTRKRESATEYLTRLGAAQVISTNEISMSNHRALEKESWAGAVDTVGGETLSALIRKTKYRGSIAACGLTGGAEVSATVYPFVLRGVNLLGIESVYCPMSLRLLLWNKLANDWKLPKNILDMISSEIVLEQLPLKLKEILEGQVRGRTVVRLVS